MSAVRTEGRRPYDVVIVILTFFPTWIVTVDFPSGACSSSSLASSSSGTSSSEAIPGTAAVNASLASLAMYWYGIVP